MVKRHLLISTNHLRLFAGSEIVTLELIEWFLSHDWAVDLLVTDFGNPIEEQLEAPLSAGSLRVFTNGQAQLSPNVYDLIWVNHSLLVPSLISEWVENGVQRPVVWHHMSAFEPLEMPFLTQLEQNSAWKIFAVSAEVRKKLTEFGLMASAIDIFDNPAPLSFAEGHKRERNATIDQLLVVSNHIPIEVREAGDILTSRGVAVTYLGMEGDFYSRVQPDILLDFDAVITIGKTVQYCLMAGIPVYNYDHFGGAGWLTASNFEQEALWNFSGRTDERKLGPSEIAHELLAGFPAAFDWLSSVRSEMISRYSLEKRLVALVNELEEFVPRPPIKKQLANRAIAMSGVRWGHAGQLNNLRSALVHRENLSEIAQHRALETEQRAERAELRALETEQRAERAELRAQEATEALSQIHESLSWRLTAPLRFLKRLLATNNGH